MWKISVLTIATLASFQAYAQDTGWGAETMVAPVEKLEFTKDPYSNNYTDQYGQVYTKKEVTCYGFDKVEVTIDGVKTKIFQITTPEQLGCIPPQPKAPWKVLKTEWAHADETNWRSFVQSMGKSSCRRVETCLASSANPFRDQIDLNAVHYSDCADFPMYLRAYFSYKNNLPFSFGYELVANDLNQGQLDIVAKRREQAIAKGQEAEFDAGLADIRYSMNGNHYESRVNIPNSAGAGRDFFTVADLIHNQISSGSFRMLFTPAGKPQADFYSPLISKESIVPGTVLYKPTGHVAIVYDVTPEGDVRYMDAHPDGSVSRGAFSSEYMQSTPSQSAGFKNFRPIKLTNAVKNAEGVITKAKVEFVPDNQIADFSLEQYFGNVDGRNSEWTKAEWSAKGRKLNLYDYVKVRLANGVYKLNPIFDFKKGLSALCTDLQSRTNTVQNAITNGIHTKAHPANLPRNIYGAEGEWESYSSPGGDLRIRVLVKNILDSTKKYMTKWQSRDPFFEYEGTNLKADLIKTYYQQDVACKISYTNSAGETVNMGLSTALQRLAKVSFDPYFCPERRWGATSTAELATCKDTADKTTWYDYQQFLRNATERDPTEVMGWGLNDLMTIVNKGAVDNKDKSAEYNIAKRLQAL